MTPHHTPDSQPPSVEQTLMHQGLPDIFRTPWYEATSRREQWPEKQLIASDGLRS